MKVEKVVSIPDQEVRIDICLEDILIALREEQQKAVAGWVYAVKVALNDTGKFLKAISDEQIAAMGPDSRRVICQFLKEQAKRYEVQR